MKNKNLNNLSCQKTLVFILLLCFKVSVFQGQGIDWLAWRGPVGNGSTLEDNWDPAVLSQGDRVLWRTQVGMGHSAVAVHGQKVFTMGNYEVHEGDFQDKVVCLHAEDGHEIWSYSFPCPELEDPGPFSTPVYHQGRIYTLSRKGHLHCFDAENGTLFWMRHLIIEKLVPEESYFATSPVIFRNHVILNLNERGISFHNKTGGLLWNSDHGGYGLNTPVLFKQDDDTLMIIQTNKTTRAIDPRNGSEIWSLPRAYIPDPIFMGNQFLLCARGMCLYRLHNDRPVLIWDKTQPRPEFQSYVVSGNCAYGFGSSGGPSQLYCIDLTNGDIRWSTSMKGGSLITSRGYLIITDLYGKLIIAETNPDAYKEVFNEQIIHLPEKDTKGRGYRRESGCWTNPVLSHGKIYIRSTYGELVCLDVGN